MAEANANETQVPSKKAVEGLGRKSMQEAIWGKVTRLLTWLLRLRIVVVKAEDAEVPSQGSVRETGKISKQGTTKERSKEKAAVSPKSSDTYFFLGIFTVISLIFVAPNFMSKLLDGQFDLRLLVHDLSIRVSQLKGLMAKAPMPVRLRNAIIAQESDGNHQLLNASGSGAMGLGQIMPENLPSWSLEALGREVSTNEFLSNPDLQLQIIDHKLNQYWQESLAQTGGNEQEAVLRVAAWWYSGNPDKFTDTTPQYWNGDAYPSIAEYANHVLALYLKQ
jgi:hypothetical protein